MKLVGYLRVSTEKQGQNGDGMGLDVQKQGIEEWAAANGHEVVTYHVDESSGTNGLDKRLGLAAALKQIRDPDIGGIVVWKLDRLARDLVLQEQLLQTVWKTGREAFSASPAEAAFMVQDDPGDPSRRLIRQVLGAVADYERAMIALRLTLGRAAKAKMGGYAYGAPPYGWQSIDKKLVKNPDEQLVIARIKSLRANGWSIGHIAAALNAEDIPSPRGTEWHKSAVDRILRRAQESETTGE